VEEFDDLLAVVTSIAAEKPSARRAIPSGGDQSPTTSVRADSLSRIATTIQTARSSPSGVVPAATRDPNRPPARKTARLATIGRNRARARSRPLALLSAGVRAAGMGNASIMERRRPLIGAAQPAGMWFVR